MFDPLIAELLAREIAWRLAHPAKVIPFMKYTCPVCYWPNLTDPPADWHICPCCGTEFEYDDAFKSHELLRAEWESGGYPWFSQALRPPPGWNGRKQISGYCNA